MEKLHKMAKRRHKKLTINKRNRVRSYFRYDSELNADRREIISLCDKHARPLKKTHTLRLLKFADNSSKPCIECLVR